VSIPAAGRIGGALDLIILHALKQREQLSLVRVLIQSRTLQCNQQFVRCF
jgi:hypothetical protein